MSDDSNRPQPRDKRLGTSVDQELYDKAVAKAALTGRTVSDILRSWVTGWVDDEFPDPPVLPGSGKRAKKRKK